MRYAFNIKVKINNFGRRDWLVLNGWAYAFRGSNCGEHFVGHRILLLNRSDWEFIWIGRWLKFSGSFRFEIYFTAIDWWMINLSCEAKFLFGRRRDKRNMLSDSCFDTLIYGNLFRKEIVWFMSNYNYEGYFLFCWNIFRCEWLDLREIMARCLFANSSNYIILNSDNVMSTCALIEVKCLTCFALSFVIKSLIGSEMTSKLV